MFFFYISKAIPGSPDFSNVVCHSGLSVCIAQSFSTHTGSVVAPEQEATCADSFLEAPIEVNDECVRGGSGRSWARLFRFGEDYVLVLPRVKL